MIKKEFMGESFVFEETATAQLLIDEIFADCYNVFKREIPILPGDVVLDFGACEGMFSIMIGKLFPQAVVYAFEPVKRTFNTLFANLFNNRMKNVHPRPYGIGKEDGKVEMVVSKDYSGGSSSKIEFNPEHHYKEEVDVKSFQSILAKEGISKVKLMKIDIEGMEYESLYYTDLSMVEYMVGEFHTNRNLEYDGRRIDGLANFLGRKVKLVGVEACKMSD